MRGLFLPATGAALAVWLGLYLLLHAAIRLIFSDSIQLDDAEQVVLGQELALGYDIPQPPLYTWIYWALSQWLGVGLPTLTLIKYAMIAAMFVVLWKIACFLFEQTVWRVAVVLAYLLLQIFAWQMHVGFTHTVLMMLACAMTFHGLLLLTQANTWLTAAYLALAMTVGLLAKYGYHLYLLALLIAAFTDKDWRSRLLSPKPALALVVALALAAPYHVWLYQHREWIAHAVANKFHGEHQVAIGWLQPLLAVLEYLLPLLPMMFWFEPRFLQRLMIKSPLSPQLLLARFHWVVLILLLLAVMSANLSYFKARWMTPFLFLTPFWLLVNLQQSGLKSAFRIIGTATTVSLLIMIGRIGDFLVSPHLGRQDRVHLPVVKALQQLPESCRQAEVVMTPNNFIAAHVLSLWPDKAVYSQAIRPSHAVNPQGAFLAVVYEPKPSWPGIHHYLNTVFGRDFSQTPMQTLPTVEAYNRQTKFNLNCSVLEW